MKKILVIRLSAMGDVAMAAPVVDRVANSYPDRDFLILTSNRFDAFFEGVNNVECVCVSKKQTTGIVALWKLFREIIKNHEIDFVVDLHSVLRTQILELFFKLNRIKVFSIDKKRALKRAIIEHKISNNTLLPKVVFSYVNVFNRAGLQITLDDKLILKKGDISCFNEKFQRKNIKENFIGLAPFAQHLGKKLPEAIVEELLKKLTENSDNRIFLFGGSVDEKLACEKWSNLSDQIISTVREFSLSDELKFISNLDVMISMDSGAQHMSSLVGVRAITVWGATHPSLGYLGFGQSYSDCICSSVDCTPCSVYGGKPCYKETYECLNSVSVDRILALINTTDTKLSDR